MFTLKAMKCYGNYFMKHINILLSSLNKQLFHPNWYPLSEPMLTQIHVNIWYHNILTLKTNFSEILIEIHTFPVTKNAFENVVCKMAVNLSRPHCVKTRAGASTTRVLVLPKMINMNILKTLYSSTTRVLIFQYSYSYVEYSPQPWLRQNNTKLI